MNQDLSGKSVLVTGGASGIGLATAELLASLGCRVLIADKNIQKLDAVIEDLKQKGLAVHGSYTDVGHPEEVATLFEMVDKLFGGLDILVNDAALPANGVLNTPLEDWQAIFGANMIGYLLCSREAVARMKVQQSGDIVNIGSVCVHTLNKGASMYITTKAAVTGFSHTLRKEVYEDGIRVSLIHPGSVATGMVSETEEQKRDRIAHGLMMEPSEIAEGVVFCLTRSPHSIVTELDMRPRGQSGL